MAKSFRLQFVDIDSSYTINTTEAAVKGYIVVRAPKGTTEAMYFNYGNEKAINAMIGLPTANWIDLYEAVAFNREYGLYISAPAGTGADYPSYYGGAYLTTRGDFNYWHVSDADNPSFEICLKPGSEPGSWGGGASASSIKILTLSKNYTVGGKSNDAQGLIEISNISMELMGKLNYFNIHYWGAEGCPVSDGVITYKVDGDKIYYVDPDEGINTDIQCGIVRKGTTGTLYIGGSSTSMIEGVETAVSNNVKGQNIPWIDFKNLFKYDELRNISSDSKSVTLKAPVDHQNLSGETLTYTNVKGDQATAEPNAIYTVLEDVSTTTASGEFYPLLLDDGTVLTSQTEIENHIKKTLIKGLQAETVYSNADTKEELLTAEAFAGIEAGNRIDLRINIKDITFCRIHQKSPNEVPTVVEISNIGYDKWQYDQQCAWLNMADLKNGSVQKTKDNPKGAPVSAVTEKNVNTVSLPEDAMDLIMATNPNGYVIVVNTEVAEKNQKAVYKLDISSGCLEDVTNLFLTQKFYINAAIRYNDAWTTTINDNDNEFGGLVYTVWEIATASTKPFKHTSFQCTETDKTYTLKKNVNYNTLTVSCKEVVYPGEYTSGGEFTGSLSETGTDSFGSNIYWPNILPEEAVTFIEVVPVNTFDKVLGPGNLDAINDQGFFIGEKIVDPIGPAQDLYSNYLTGQRYCTHINEDNQKNGLLGCTWRNEYYPIIKDGIIEAQNPDYDDALVFMEPSGYEEFKPDLMSLRVKYHDTSTIISPKIITKAELLNPKTIVVSGRSKGTAQYIGEFKKYDTYTGKHYYCQPIGDVGLQLARIMDKKMGGIAPAGTNDSAGLGGCLARPVLSAKWKFSDDALKTLDEKGLCAITYDADNGLMIQSQKSTQDPSMVTDWSYLGHSMSFDLCKREIRDKVMVQQVFKRINQYWMDIRTKQVQAILDKRTTGTDPIWAMANVDITGQNTPTTMAKRQFVIKVTCKVYVYSETVLLIFENLAQE